MMDTPVYCCGLMLAEGPTRLSKRAPLVYTNGISSNSHQESPAKMKTFNAEEGKSRNIPSNGYGKSYRIGRLTGFQWRSTHRPTAVGLFCMVTYTT